MRKVVSMSTNALLRQTVDDKVSSKKKEARVRRVDRKRKMKVTMTFTAVLYPGKKVLACFLLKKLQLTGLKTLSWESVNMRVKKDSTKQHGTFETLNWRSSLVKL